MIFCIKLNNEVNYTWITTLYEIIFVVLFILKYKKFNLLLKTYIFKIFHELKIISNLEKYHIRHWLG